MVAQRAVEQGEVYWMDFGEPRGSAPGYRRPCIVIQNNTFNRSRINTVVVCVVTSNLRLARAPGNVLLDEGEAGLPRRSVANVSQVVTVDRDSLEQRVGALAADRLRVVLDGVRLVIEPRGVDAPARTEG